MAFRLTVRGNLIQVEVRPHETSYALREGDGLTVTHDGEVLQLTPQAPTATRPNAEGA